MSGIVLLPLLLGAAPVLPEEDFDARPEFVFEAVVWKPAPGRPDVIGFVSLVVRRPDEKLETYQGAVQQTARAAVRVAKRFEALNGGKVGVVYYVRGPGRGETAACTGFAVEQLEEYLLAGPEEARKRISRHAWTSGRIPKPE